MLDIARRDAPWAWGYHPIEFGLYHEWFTNAKPMTIGGGTLKYQRLNPELREIRREQWNTPIWWPVAVALALFLLASAPAIYTVWKRERGIETP